MFLKKYRTALAEKNLVVNQANEEPNAFINGQSAYSNYRFGLSAMDKVGCGIIGIYNVLRLLGSPERFTDLIREFETNSTETIPFGFFGINPFSMKKYFEAHHIPYSKIRGISDLDQQKKEGGVYLLTFWNNAQNWFKGAHTVALCYTEERFVVYNRTNSGREPVEYTNTADVIGNGLLICGYQLYGDFYDGEELV